MVQPYKLEFKNQPLMVYVKNLLEIYVGKSQLDGSERTITINPTSLDNFSDISKTVMQGKHLMPGETILQGFARACCAFSDDSAHAQRLLDYASKGWFKFPTPVLSNGGTEKGLAINCYLSQIGDDMGSIAEHFAENMFLAVRGGGIGTDMSLLRSIGTPTSKGNYTPGIIPFCRVIDSQILASIQGSTRRGAAALYLDVSHPEIEEFIEIRKPTGDQNRRSHNIHNAVSIPDTFMKAVEEGTSWNLIDPHTKEITKTVDARGLWMKILSLRVSTGEPYLFFIDTANKALPQHLKDKGMRINLSNLCTEIMLPTTPDRTAVCCLSSVNLEHFDDWSKDENFVEDLLRMLDNILEVFVLKADHHMWRAVESAKNERSVGLGALGFHTLLQKKGVPWESAMATSWNIRVFKHLKEKCDAANLKLGKEKGEAPDAKGTGLRFSHTQAIAPNASATLTHNSVSPSIEPLAANAFTHKTQSGVFLIKNQVLDNLFKTKYSITEKNLDKVWQSVILNEGSVQHLEFLDANDKDVFKTAMELDQQWIIEHAASRQPFIDQGQSVNLFISPTISKGELHALHKMAWTKGLKALYYCRSKSVGKTEKISNIEEVEVDWKVDTSECLSCEG
jgi:ribonucleoside-diphosphate reductase alpha chain